MKLIGFIADGGFDLINRRFLAYPVRGVRHVTEGGRYMSDLDVGVLVAALVAANSLDKVLVMPLTTAAGELLDLLTVVIEDPAAAVIGWEVTTFALYTVADARAAVMPHRVGAFLHGQPAHFE